MNMRDKWNSKHELKIKEKKRVQANERLQYVSPHFTAGVALDIACGLGANSMYLADKGYQVHSYDISTVAINYLRKDTSIQNLPIEANVVDLIEYEKLPFLKNKYDLVVITYYLDRKIIPFVKSVVKEKGYFFMETYFQAEIDDKREMQEKFKLQPQELLHTFEDWHVLYYEEKEGRQTIFAKK